MSVRSFPARSLKGPSPEATAQLQRTGTSPEEAGAPPLGLSTAAQNPGSPSNTEGRKGPSQGATASGPVLPPHRPRGLATGTEPRRVSLRPVSQPTQQQETSPPTNTIHWERRNSWEGAGQRTDRTRSEPRLPRSERKANTTRPELRPHPRGRISSDHTGPAPSDRGTRRTCHRGQRPKAASQGSLPKKGEHGGQGRHTPRLARQE